MARENRESIDLNSFPIEIEEIDSLNLDPKELSQFVETSTISSNAGNCSYIIKQELDGENDATLQDGIWIKKFINGEVSYSEYRAQVEQNEDLDQEIEEEITVSQSKNFEKDFSNSRRDVLKGNLQGPQKKGEGRGKRSKRFLPPALQGLMGQANLCYARGDFDMAKNVCLEIIRQVPLAHEPFITLAQIYETEDPDKCMQFSLIAAHLNPSDVELWVRLAEQSLEIDNVEQSLNCYGQAIKAEPKNFDVRMKRIELLESIGEEKQAFKSYFAMLPFIPKERSDFLIATAKRLAQKFHQENNIVSALEAMERAYQSVPELFKTEDINLLLELLISTGVYRRALDVLIIHTSVEVKEIVSEETANSIYSVDIPTDMILDFRTKLAVILVHLKCYNLLDYIIANIFANIDVEEAGDCYLDVAEALMKEEQFRFALRLLVPLVKSENFSLAAVWLRHADCLRAIGDYQDAIKSYKRVVSMAQHLNARLTLAALLKQQGNYDEALKALEQDPGKDVLDPELLYERCLMLKEVGEYEKYLADGYLLLSRHFILLKSRHELVMAVSIQKLSSFISTLKEIRKLGDDQCEQPEFSKSNNEPSVETEWDLFWDLLKTAYEMKNFNYFQKLSFMAHTSKKFHSHKRELEFLSLLACIYNRDPHFGYNFVKEWVARDHNIDNPRLWNLFNLVILVTEDIRYNRYLMRLFHRREVNVNARALQANYHLNSGTYKYALNDYLSIYQQTKEPIHAMLVAVTLAQIASQKYTNKKHGLISQAISFMEEYRKNRPQECLHEVYYNIGRMYQQLGMVSLAVSHYKMALEITNDMIREHPKHLDLRHEIAFNLSVAYRSTGNIELARKYLYEYIEI